MQRFATSTLRRSSRYLCVISMKLKLWHSAAWQQRRKQLPIIPSPDAAKVAHKVAAEAKAAKAAQSTASKASAAPKGAPAPNAPNGPKKVNIETTLYK